MNFKSLQNRLLVPIITIVFTGIVLTIGVSYIKSANAVLAVSKENIAQAVTLVSDRLNQHIKNSKLEVGMWGSDPSLIHILNDEKDSQRLNNAQQYLSRIFKHQTSFSNLRICNAEGKTIISAEDHKEMNLSDRDYIQNAISGNTFVSNPLKSRATGQPFVSVSSPIKSEEGSVVGVIYGTIDLYDYYTEYISPIKLPEGSYIFVCDDDGLLCMHPQKKLIMELNIRSLSIGNTILNGDTGSIEYEFQGLDKLAHYVTLPKTNWKVVITADKGIFLAEISAMQKLLFILGGALVLITATSLFMIVRSITNPLRKISSKLHAGAGDINNASVEISTASQQLADGACEQAASLEETSASFEEMTSQITQNAENCSEAEKLSASAKKQTDVGQEAMQRLSQAINEIKASADETAKIVKTIDEISFQTNLLALNAAVEAARAGEAGKGFAVVAEEVRSLAQRAADAARNTGGLIEQSIVNSDRGVEVSAEVAEILHKIATQSDQVNTLIAEISTSSDEQSKGADMINKAVSQIDTVTQSNAATSEQAASAAAELSGQSQNLFEAVSELNGIIEGSSTTSSPAAMAIQSRPKTTAVAASKQNAHSQTCNVRQSAKDIPMDTENMDEVELINF